MKLRGKPREKQSDTTDEIVHPWFMYREEEQQGNKAVRYASDFLQCFSWNKFKYSFEFLSFLHVIKN